jgi:dTDP-4-dehydrorhamnose reductase
MRLVLTGATGQVGGALARSLRPLGEVVALDRARLDLTQPDRIAATIAALAPNAIVNAAADTAVDKAEAEPDLAMTVNGTAVGALAEAARRADALLVHYSTDYVFDGRKTAPYDEDDPPNPLNSYGRSKLAGETAIRAAGCDHLILRTSWIYAARGRNFLRTVLRLAEERDELRIVADQVGAPTWAESVAQGTASILAQAMAERARGAFASGIYHLTASGAVSWHGFAEAILAGATERALVRRRPRLVAIATEDYPTAAPRPRNSRLSDARLRARFGLALPDWREDLARCLDALGGRRGAG